MRDIQTYNDDFLIQQSESVDQELFYDFLLDEDYSQVLKSCLTTPIGSLKEVVLSLETGLDYKDSDLGSNLYYRLSEPLSSLWVQEVNADTQLALNQLDVPIRVEQISSSLAPEGIQLNIQYQLDGQAQTQSFLIEA